MESVEVMLLLLQRLTNNYEDDDYYELTKDIRLMLSLASKNGIKKYYFGFLGMESLIIIQL
jgi:hypothetical protein